MTFGQMIKEERGLQLLTQEQAAALCGVGLRTWQRWETDGSVPRQEETNLVIEALGLNREIVAQTRMGTGTATAAGLKTRPPDGNGGQTATTSGG